jgi:NodT family efflux transporter outer membrane factor (OMF) lipoprotein
MNKPQITLPAAFDAPQGSFETGQQEQLDRWWDRFNDPQLAELVDLALTRSTDARTAYFRVIEARAAKDQSLSQRLPSGNLTASTKIQGGQQFEGQDFFGSTATARTFSGGFVPSWELDLFGRLSATGSAARATYAAEAYDYHATRLALAGDVATALFEARGLAVQRQDAIEALRIAEALGSTSQLGFDRGLVAGVDTARLDGDVATARADIVRIDTLLRNAKRALLVLTGRADLPVETLTIEATLDVPPVVPGTMPSTLLLRRPDLLAAAERLAAAAAQVKVDRLALFPQLTLQGSGTMTKTIGALGGTSGIWSLAFGLALPILDRPRLMARLRMTEAQGEQAVIAYEAAVQAAFRDADNALASVAADLPRMALLYRAEERSRFSFEATRRGYRIGLFDLTTLLQSERTWRSARTTLTRARTQALGNVVAAFRALGGGWDPETPATAPGEDAIALPVAPASSSVNSKGKP